MWLTIDMAAPATVSEIHFDSPAAFAGQGGPAVPGRLGQAVRGGAAAAPGAAVLRAGAAPAGAPAAGPHRRRRAARRARPAAGAGRRRLVRRPRSGPAVLPTGVSTHPRAYEVHVSLDGQTWGLPVASGKGAPGSTTIVLEQPVRARYIRITQTGDRGRTGVERRAPAGLRPAGAGGRDEAERAVVLPAYRPGDRPDGQPFRAVSGGRGAPRVGWHRAPRRPFDFGGRDAEDVGG